MDVELARRRVKAMIQSLEPLVESDPEQEVTGIAVPVLEAAVDAIKAVLPDDPVVLAVQGAYQHEIETGEPVRAADALFVARQLAAALPPKTAFFAY